MGRAFFELLMYLSFDISSDSAEPQQKKTTAIKRANLILFVH